MKLAYFISDHGGCSYYRAMLPLDMLHEQGLADVMRIEKGDTQDRVESALEGAEAVIFPRFSASPRLIGMLDIVKEQGKRFVVDYDDNIWKVSPLSPHYVDYGLKDVRYPFGNKMLDLWRDGTKNFSIAKNAERLKLVEDGLSQASLVTTTTEILADVLRQYNPNVAVLPNCVDLKRWRKREMKPHDDFRIFWAGGSSHYEDWLILEDVLPVVMERFPRTRLVLMGMKFQGTLKKLPQDRVEYVPWEDNLSYPLMTGLLAADLALIPLQDNEFNRCKSPIKWVEQAAIEVPCVVSCVSPYFEVYSGANMAMVANNERKAWIEAISTMIREPMVRAKMAGEALRYVQERFDVRKQAVKWLEAYQRKDSDAGQHGSGPQLHPVGEGVQEYAGRAAG